MDGAMSEPSSLAFPKRPLFPGIPSLRPYPQIGQGACRKVIPKIPTWLLPGSFEAPGRNPFEGLWGRRDWFIGFRLYIRMHCL